MSESRIDVFTQMAREQPQEVMVWYGLASEYVKIEKWGEAVEALRQVLKINPDYTAAYQMLGSALMSLGESQEARRVWTEGIETAKRTGAWKAGQHMEGLLAGMKDETGSGFCAE
ncbi:MAG TPA: tetratricopeptide repeat protein [Pyrinomonadaceae bacterium]|jgi:predicted Zn-dependent protease